MARVIAEQGVPRGCRLSPSGRRLDTVIPNGHQGFVRPCGRHVHPLVDQPATMPAAVSAAHRNGAFFLTDGQSPRDLIIPRRLIEGDRIVLPVGTEPRGGGVLEFEVPLSQLDDPSTGALLRAELADGYERAERDALSRLARSGDAFIDVGAHWGLFTLHAVALGCDPVVAMEPDADNLSRLRRNLERNGLAGRVRVVAAAAGAASGSGWLRRNTAMGHHWFADRGRAGPNSAEVATRALDEIIASDLSDASRIWIKIDVEGRERLVFEGARASLAAGRIVGVLWETSVGGLANPDASTIDDQLSALGFRTRRISPTNVLSLGPSIDPDAAQSLEGSIA